MSRSVVRRLAGALILTAALAAAAVPAVSGAEVVRRTWAATFAGGAGTGSLTSYVSAVGLLRLNVGGLVPNAAAAARVYAGSCARLRGLITEVEGLRTSSSATLRRDIRVSAYRMNKVWASVQAGAPLALWVVSGGTGRCAELTAPVATRVVVPSLGIDLPVVKPPSTSSYPLCNVAEYLQVRWQPGEHGGTFLYAHARQGMFLPLLTESRRAGGGRLPGALIDVYTSDSKRYTYRITQVLRSQYYLPPPSNTTTRLWLQTSEGPRGTRNKLILVASQIGVSAASYAAAHPTPRPVRCG